MTTTSSPAPVSDVDIFSEEVMADPYPAYTSLRAAGPVVRLESLDAWAVPRYEQVREVLGDPARFSSEGVAFNETFNQRIGDGVLRAAPPLHTQLRNVLSARLAPRAMRTLRADIARRAADLVDELVERRSFDTVADLAKRFPVGVVADLIGLPEDGRDHLLDLVDANFNCFGPANARMLQSVPRMQELGEYVLTHVTRDELAEGSWGAAVYEAVDAGEVAAEHAPWLVLTYVTAGMDTTVNALGHAIWLLSRHPDQWDALRQDPALIPQAFREVLRVESPVQVFGRTTKEDWTVEGCTVPAGSQLAVLFGSANRDERQWAEPERFDVLRTNLTHLSFGYGLHACAGQALARTEGEVLLQALAGRVERIETGTPVRHYNNVLRGLESLPTVVTPA